MAEVVSRSLLKTVSILIDHVSRDIVLQAMRG